MSSLINGMIYCLKSKHTDKVYVGSTEKTLDDRFRQHKRDYKKYLTGKYSCITSFEILKYNDCWIELLEICECESKDILRRVEGEFITQLNCVNKNVAGRTYKEYQKEYRENNKEKSKEYRENNKDKNKEYQKEYRENNKEKIKEYREEYYTDNKDKLNEKVECECGSIVSRFNLTRHKKSNKHKKLMEDKDT
jgi:hypothetical protein